MANKSFSSAVKYLEERFSELYGPEKTKRIVAHMYEREAEPNDDPSSPLQNTLNQMVYPFLTVMKALGLEGIPVEEASPLLLKLWEEMPEEIKLEGLNSVCESDGD